MQNNSKCPVTGAGRSKDNHYPNFLMGRAGISDWWPNQLDISVLSQNSVKENPYGADFDYKKEFESLDLNAVRADIFALMKDSQDWWPADYGTYAPFFIRMAWHSAGTYRTQDGRGGARMGTQRLTPLNSWPDNVNLDKARRLLWPIKKKYGKKLSWADLMIFAGNCAMESMGLKVIGFGGGREDVWQPQNDINWGNPKMLGDNNGNSPTAATQMGLIYVNPEGPNGNPNPIESAKQVRDVFGDMAMNDEETVALIAGGHTFGKTHGAAPATHLGREPAAAPIEEQNLGWKNNFGTGNAQYTIGSGLEGAWKPNPTTWDMGYLTVLLKYDYELTKSPAGAHIWLAKNVEQQDMVADAHIKGLYHRPMMTTADIGIKADPAYLKIARDYLANPAKFQDAFTKAWFKLTHRDMGPIALYAGNEVPHEQFLFQDPLPKPHSYKLTKLDIDELKLIIAKSELSVSQLVKTAWASASTFRGSDRRGGANGARIRLKPQIDWEVNEPAQLKIVLAKYEKIQKEFNECGKKYVSMADLIVLGGAAGIEQAARFAGEHICVPFSPGRVDATQENTDMESFAYLEPKYDGFRNYDACPNTSSPEEKLIDRAQLLNLTTPEMTVLLGGLRVLNNNYCYLQSGVLTHRPEMLTNDFFVNLLDMDTAWKPTSDKNLFVGLCRHTGKQKWTATRADLIFGSHAGLRAVAEVYAADCAKDKFLHDFVAAWNKVMNADRFDLHN